MRLFAYADHLPYKTDSDISKGRKGHATSAQHYCSVIPNPGSELVTPQSFASRYTTDAHRRQNSMLITIWTSHFESHVDCGLSARRCGHRFYDNHNIRKNPCNGFKTAFLLRNIDAQPLIHQENIHPTLHCAFFHTVLERCAFLFESLDKQLNPLLLLWRQFQLFNFLSHWSGLE